MCLKDTKFLFGEITICRLKGEGKKQIRSQCRLFGLPHVDCQLYGSFQVSYVFCNYLICKLFLLHQNWICGLVAKHVWLFIYIYLNLFKFIYLYLGVWPVMFECIVRMCVFGTLSDTSCVWVFIFETLCERRFNLFFMTEFTNASG